MLKTYETEPQVLVQVGEFPAVCHNLTCNYTYVVPVGEVNAYSFDNSTKTLVINGTELPTNTSDIRKIEFAHSKCSIQNISTVNNTITHTTVTNVSCNSSSNSSGNSSSNSTSNETCNVTTTTYSYAIS